VFLAIVMKKTFNDRDASRREFVRESFRYAALTGVAAVSVLLFKRGGGKLSGQSCINQGICRGCTAFAGCGLPQALSARQARQRGES
jgi:hypothetical protein